MVLLVIVNKDFGMRLVTEKCQISIKQETLVYKTYCVSIGIYAGDRNKRKKEMRNKQNI